LGTTLKSVRAEIKALAAQLEAQQVAASHLDKQQGLADFACSNHDANQITTTSLSHSASSTDSMPHAAVPPPSTHACVVCTRTTPRQGKLRTHRPRDGVITHCNWAFLSSAWANVVQDIPNDVALGTRDWRPRCATYFARGANEDLAGHSSSSNSQSTSSSSSTSYAPRRKLDSYFSHHVNMLESVPQLLALASAFHAKAQPYSLTCTALPLKHWLRPPDRNKKYGGREGEGQGDCDGLHAV
jgi:hypothetical protein